LQVGKLTARVEKDASRSEAKEATVPRSSFAVSKSSSALFAIRTPTAVVTDLGTEFGVEVDEKGKTVSHVFRGVVNVRTICGKGSLSAAELTLHANESACTERTAKIGPEVALHRISLNPSGFARRLKETSPVQVLAWFRMGEDDSDAAPGKAVGAKVSDHRNYARLERSGSPVYSSDTPIQKSTLSMHFNGGVNGECLSVPRFPFVPNDYFILEAWVKMHRLKDYTQVVVENGGEGRSGYGIAAIQGRWHFVLEGAAVCDSGVACELNKWTHLALVCERGVSQLWVNGISVGIKSEILPNVPEGPFEIGGDLRQPERVFDGEIDEVRLSTFVGPFEPSMLLHQAVLQKL
jgi:hypothetical protein